MAARAVQGGGRGAGAGSGGGGWGGVERGEGSAGGGVRDAGVDSVDLGGEGAQLDLVRVGDVSRVALLPRLRAAEAGYQVGIAPHVHAMSTWRVPPHALRAHAARAARHLGHVDVVVGVDEEVEGARLVEEGQEGDRGRDLPDDRLDLGRDLLLGLFHLVRARVGVWVGGGGVEGGRPMAYTTGG